MNTQHKNQWKGAVIVLLLIAMASIFVVSATALGSGEPKDMKMRVIGYNPATNEYQFKCSIPPNTPGSNVNPRKFFAIDPIPQGHNPSYYSPCNPTYTVCEDTINWTLNAENYTELVHTQAMYHVYCEVQNYSAPPGQQNKAVEIHVDLRTDRNTDVPNIYVLESNGPNLTLKCDPPPGVKQFTNTWTLRSREGSMALPEFNNQRIINTTIPEISGGWDYVCAVQDLETGRTSRWDMPIEFFETGPAYVPTIEGCLPNQPCPWAETNGTLLNGTLNVSVNVSNVNIYINEKLVGMTDDNGRMIVPNIIPGLHNLILRKEGYEEHSTLIPIATGKILSRTYGLSPPTNNTAPPPPPSNGSVCYTNMFDIPATCTGGTITSDITGGCRTIICGAGNNSLKVLACNKPGNNDAQYFEMYKQAQTGNGIKICIGETCIQNEGYKKSTNYPICIGTNSTNNTQQPQNISFASTTPNNNSITINESENIQFAYALSNPDGILTNASWFLNNIMQSSNVGQNIFLGTYNFVSHENSSGTYNVSIKVSSPQNTIQRSWTLIVIDSISGTNGTNQTNSTGNTTGNGTGNSGNTTNTTVCFSNLQNAPTSCTGGTITTDNWNGCRLLICTGNSNSLQILACDKPGVANAQYFEMYKQAQTGNGIKICIGETCIQNEGYKKSPNYPLCTAGNTTPATPQNISFTSTTPTTNPTISEPNNQTFSYTLSNPSGLTTTTTWRLNGALQAATGTTYQFLGGYTTQGTYNVSVRVQSSQNILQRDWMLTVNDVQQPNSTNSTTNQSISANVAIAPWFPQGRSYVFLCNAEGFTPTHYDFTFGDGNKNIGRTSKDVYHTYASAGTYNVDCTARDATMSAQGVLQVIVS